MNTYWEGKTVLILGDMIVYAENLGEQTKSLLKLRSVHRKVTEYEFYI